DRRRDRRHPRLCHDQPRARGVRRLAFQAGTHGPFARARRRCRQGETLMADDHKTSADIQRELEAHRHRMESKIDETQARLSPGQLIDEVLSYSKGGGTEFRSTLGQTASRNPLPVPLLGVSLAWLIAGPRN